MDSFETGPIRPPSEAGSYLIRLTRGCPWNKCKFCRSYRRHKFEIRDVAEVVVEALEDVGQTVELGLGPVAACACWHWTDLSIVESVDAAEHPQVSIASL